MKCGDSVACHCFVMVNEIFYPSAGASGGQYMDKYCNRISDQKLRINIFKLLLPFLSMFISSCFCLLHIFIKLVISPQRQELCSYPLGYPYNFTSSISTAALNWIPAAIHNPGKHRF